MGGKVLKESGWERAPHSGFSRVIVPPWMLCHSAGTGCSLLPQKNCNLIGKGGQFWGSLARDSWGEDAGMSKASLQRMLHSSVVTGAKGGTGGNFAAEFCLVVWSYDKNTSSIFQDTIFFVVLVSFLVNACILFLLV